MHRLIKLNVAWIVLRTIRQNISNIFHVCQIINRFQQISGCIIIFGTIVNGWLRFCFVWIYEWNLFAHMRTLFTSKNNNSIIHTPYSPHAKLFSEKEREKISNQYIYNNSSQQIMIKPNKKKLWQFIFRLTDINYSH